MEPLHVVVGFYKGQPRYATIKDGQYVITEHLAEAKSLTLDVAACVALAIEVRTKLVGCRAVPLDKAADARPY